MGDPWSKQEKKNYQKKLLPLLHASQVGESSIEFLRDDVYPVLRKGRKGEGVTRTEGCVWRHGYMRIRFNVWRILCPLVNLKPLFGVFGKRWGEVEGVEEITTTPEKKTHPARRWRDEGGGQIPSQAGRRG